MAGSFKYVFAETPASWSMNSCHLSLSFSSDGTTLAGTVAADSPGYRNGMVLFWETTTGAVTSLLDSWSYIVFSPTDREMAVVMGSAGMRVVRRAPGGQTWSLQKASSNNAYPVPHVAAFRPDGRRVTVTDTGLYIWELELSGLTPSNYVLFTTRKTFAVAYCPTEPNIVAVGRENGDINIASYASRSVLCQLSPVGSTEISATAWSPDGKWLATGDKAGDVRLWSVISTVNVSLSKQLPHVQRSTVNTLIFLPDSTELLISCGCRLSVWDIAHSNYVTDSGLPTVAKNIALDGPRNRIAVATDNKITLYEFKLTQNIPQNPVAVTTDGRDILHEFELGQNISQDLGRQRQKGKQVKGTPSLPPELAAFDLTANLVKSKLAPFEGSYFNIYRGAWKLDTPRIFQPAVAIKVLRTGFNPLSKGQERKDFEDLLIKSLITWSKLLHDNLVSLLGVSTDFGRFPAMVTSWMSYGPLREYLVLNELDSNDKLDFAIGVANGVAYLHSNDIVHGDIRASSVLVDELGNARVADPGLLRILAKSPLVTNKNIMLPYRWMAPELVQDSSMKPTSATDVYSVMMTSLEIFTGSPPFKGIGDALIGSQIVQGIRPDEPDDVDDELWSLWVEGWDQHAHKRPTMGSYVASLNQLAGGQDRI